MSSSEDDLVVQPVKRLKRRRYSCDDEDSFEPVNLFSHKVMPELSKVNETVLKKLTKGELVIICDYFHDLRVFGL